MRLQLKRQPTPANAPNFADDIVATTLKVLGIELNYSVESLKAIDDIVEKMRQDGCAVHQIAETLFGFGCYVGEVFVRHAGGQWRNASETPMAKLAGFPLVVELGPKSVCNPIGKVFKRLRDGEAENLPYFYQVFTKKS